MEILSNAVKKITCCLDQNICDEKHFQKNSSFLLIGRDELLVTSAVSAMRVGLKVCFLRQMLGTQKDDDGSEGSSEP
jgi:hypothetical protein